MKSGSGVKSGSEVNSTGRSGLMLGSEMNCYDMIDDMLHGRFEAATNVQQRQEQLQSLIAIYRLGVNV